MQALLKRNSAAEQKPQWQKCNLTLTEHIRFALHKINGYWNGPTLFHWHNSQICRVIHSSRKHIQPIHIQCSRKSSTLHESRTKST